MRGDSNRVWKTFNYLSSKYKLLIDRNRLFLWENSKESDRDFWTPLIIVEGAQIGQENFNAIISELPLTKSQELNLALSDRVIIKFIPIIKASHT